MTNNFMDNVRLRSVIWVFHVSEILSGAEDFEGKRVEKFPLT